jgi:hypothetical protein
VLRTTHTASGAADGLLPVDEAAAAADGGGADGGVLSIKATTAATAAGTTTAETASSGTSTSASASTSASTSASASAGHTQQPFPLVVQQQPLVGAAAAIRNRRTSLVLASEVVPRPKQTTTAPKTGGAPGTPIAGGFPGRR